MLNSLKYGSNRVLNGFDSSPYWGYGWNNILELYAKHFRREIAGPSILARRRFFGEDVAWNESIFEGDRWLWRYYSAFIKTLSKDVLKKFPWKTVPSILSSGGWAFQKWKLNWDREIYWDSQEWISWNHKPAISSLAIFQALFTIKAQ